MRSVFSKLLSVLIPYKDRIDDLGCAGTSELHNRKCGGFRVSLSCLSCLYRGLNSYCLATIVIVGWWFLAFQHERPISQGYYHPNPDLNFPLPLFEDHGLFSINREQLHQALSGDLLLMGKLIAEWDVDAQLLLSKGYESVKRLSPKDYLHSQWLSRHFKNHSETNYSPIQSDSQFKKFLPQTYLAASFLLALSPPEEIVALPPSLRKLIQLYPRSLTDKIPLDIDRCNSEKLFMAKPEIAFVASYSNPATIQTLSNQGIALYMTKDLSTLPDILKELLSIGNIANRPLEAEMLKIFMEAAMAANDNKIIMLTKYYADNHLPFPRVLYLNYHQNFSIPTLRTITGQLLKRLGALDITLSTCLPNDTQKIMIPLDKERLLNLNPDYLIVAAENHQALEKEIRRDAAFSELKALQKNKLFFVDEAIQDSPTQYIVLAYHDLIHVLTQNL